MGWFTRKIDDPEKTFKQLISTDKTLYDAAKKDFVNNFNVGFVEFLCEKFEDTEDNAVKMKILEVFADAKDKLTEEMLRMILPFLKNPDQLLRETFKEILLGINEDNVKAVTEVLSSTKDASIHKTIQYGLDNSGFINEILKKWKSFKLKEQILFLEEIVLLQNPKTYPIFMDIMRDETIEAKKEDKKIIQIEFHKHIHKITNPEFLATCIRDLPAISVNMRYPVFKCLQTHGQVFFDMVFDGLGKKSEGFRQHSLKLMEQLSDPLSYPFLFPFLLDTYKAIPPIVRTAIGKIIKDYAEKLSEMTPEQRASEETMKRNKYFIDPLEEHMNDRFFSSIKLLTEGLLRIGKYDNDVILRNFPKLFRYNASYLKSFIKGLEMNVRKKLLIDACCYKETATGFTALKILGDPSENYIIETLNSLLLEHFMHIPKDVQAEVINLMMNPRLKRFVSEVLYHPDPELRSRILWILGESGSPNALAILQTKIRDQDFSVRENLLKILDLPHFQNQTGTELLMEFLKDTDMSIVLRTIEELKERDHPKIISNLTKVLSSPTKEIKDSAHKAIAFITRRKYMQGFEKMSDETKYAIGLSLTKMDPTFMEDITRDLSASDQRTRVLSAKILEILCDHISPELRTHLIIAIQDPDPHVRAVVIMGLGKIGGPSVSGMLVGFLQDPDDRVRANAVEAMAEVGDISLAPKILPCLDDDNNRVRGNAITTLWKLGYYQIYDSIMKMLQHKDKWMRASAAFSLGELKDSRFMPLLLQCIRDPEANVRQNVVKSLGKIGNAYVLAPYIRPLRFDPDEGVRNEVMQILNPKPAKK